MLRGVVALLHEPSTQPCKLGVADRSRLLQAVKLLDFICGAEANHTPKFIACLLCALHIAIRHALSLEDQIGKHSDERKHYPADYPNCLAPPRDIAASKQISGNSNKQP